MGRKRCLPRLPTSHQPRLGIWSARQPAAELSEGPHGSEHSNVDFGETATPRW